MQATSRFWRYLVLPLSFAGMLSISSAAELNPAAVIYKLPDQIPWTPVSPSGAQNAVVVGDPSKPGFYAVYTKWTKGNHFSRPHFHPNDRYIVVLQGTWWVGSGPKFDQQSSFSPTAADEDVAKERDCLRDPGHHPDHPVAGGVTDHCARHDTDCVANAFVSDKPAGSHHFEWTAFDLEVN